MSCGVCLEDGKDVTGLDPKNMDLKVAPGHNFYNFANGTWLSNNPIPGEYPSWNTFTALHDANLSRLKTLFEELPSPKVPAVSGEDKVAAYWASAIDEDAIEAAGLTPLAAVLAVCDGASADKTAAVATLQATYGVNAFFAIDEGPDDKDSPNTLLQMFQGGLGLPDRDYYFDEDKAEQRGQYEAHVAKLLEMLGDSSEVATAGAARHATEDQTRHFAAPDAKDPTSISLRSPILEQCDEAGDDTCAVAPHED